MAEIQKMKRFVEKYPEVNKPIPPVNIGRDQVITKTHSHYNLETLKRTKWSIWTFVPSQCLQASLVMATNMKAACLLTEEIRLNTPLLRCVSYAPSGTVKLCTSEMKSDGDAKA